MKPPIHLLMNAAGHPDPDAEAVLFRARGRELSRGRRRTRRRVLLARLTRAHGRAGSAAPTPARTAPAPTVARPGLTPAPPT